MTRRAKAHVALGLLAATLAGLVATAPLTLRGPAFGRLVERALPASRGRLHVGGGRWSWAALWALARERPAALELEDVALVDPEGVEVLHAGRLTAKLELRRAARAAIVYDLRARGVVVRLNTDPEGALRFASALAPPTAAPSRRKGASRPFTVSVPDAVVDAREVRLDFPTWGLTLDDVRGVAASLRYEGDGSGDAKVSFSLGRAEVHDGGVLRVGSSRDAWTLPFASARVDGVSTVDGEPDALRIAARDIRTGRAALAVSGVLRGALAAPAAPASPGLSLEIAGARAADAVDTVLARRGLARPGTIGGPEAALSAVVDGPYSRLAATLEVRGLSIGSKALPVSNLGFRLAGALAPGRVRIDRLSADWRGVGRVEGGLTARASPGGLKLERLALRLTRPEAARGPRVVALDVDEARAEDGAVLVRSVELPLWRGKVRVGGKVVFRDPKTSRWLSAPRVDLTLDARRLAVGEVVGASFLRGTVSFRGRVHGPVWALVFDLAFPRDAQVTLFDEPLRLPRRMSSLLTEGAVYAHLDLAGRRGVGVTATGRVDLVGRLALDLDTKNFPLARLPAVADAELGLFGELSGKLRLSGTSDAPEIAGHLWLSPVGLQGRERGRGALELSTERTGTLHARGRLMDGVDVDGTLSTGGPGARGAVTVRLDHVLLDPVLPSSPSDVRMSGLLSGEVVVRAAPGEATSLDGTLSALELDVWRARGTAPPAAGSKVQLFARGPIPFAAKADGTKVLGPARFSGDVGIFDAAVRGAGPELRATARGRFELGALAPLAAPLLARANGAVDVDLAATWRGPGGRLALDGDIAVARPVSVRLGTIPATVGVASGRGRFVDGAFDAADLPLTVVADLPASSVISRVAGTVDLTAHVPSSGEPIALDVRTRSLALTLPLAGEAPVAAGGGRVRFEGSVASLAAFDEAALRDIDLPLRGVLRRLATPAGRIDRAAFDLRLRGVPGRTLTLSGDVDILAARLRPTAASTSPAGAAAAGPERPTLRDPRLDLRLRARDGAVTVELSAAPDVHLDVDARARGTLAHPVVEAEARPAGAYSTILVTLQRLLR